MTEEERIQKIMGMTVREFCEEYQTLTDFSDEKKYESTGWVRQKLGQARRRGVSIGVSASKLNIPAMIKTALLLDREDRKVAEGIMATKNKAGRKPNNEGLKAEEEVKE